MLAQLAPRVVQGLVQSATGRARSRSARTSIGTPFSASATRTRAGAASGPRRSRAAASPGARSARLRRRARARRSRTDPRSPARAAPPSLPGALAELDRGLEQGELVDPGREAAGAAEVVETPEHAHQRVVGGLERDVVELVAAEVRKASAAGGRPRSARRGRAARAAARRRRRGPLLTSAGRAATRATPRRTGRRAVATAGVWCPSARTTGSVTALTPPRSPRAARGSERRARADSPAPRAR